jgi:anti-anti-sigma factor
MRNPQNCTIRSTEPHARVHRTHSPAFRNPSPAPIVHVPPSPALLLRYSWHAPSTVVISAHGDIDASNASDLIVFVRHAIGPYRGLVLDLRGVTFFGTEGLSALRIIDQEHTPASHLAVVPSPAVVRLLKLGALHRQRRSPTTSRQLWSLCKAAVLSCSWLPKRACSFPRYRGRLSFTMADDGVSTTRIEAEHRPDAQREISAAFNIIQ